MTFTNNETGEVLFPVVVNGNRWSIDTQFTEADNGKKIVALISAYDKSGNTGGSAMKTVTLKIDIMPPFIDYLEIKRTDTKITYTEPYFDLFNLETLDPTGNLKANLLKYQNGWFVINGIISENETKVVSVSLKIYDARYPDIVLLDRDIDAGSITNFPKWTIKDEDIIAAGVSKLGANLPNYKADYYDNGKRYYYRVVVEAVDESTNVGHDEDEGFFCLWANSDKPKGLVDPAIGTIVSRNTPLPVNIYDDDCLYWAYTGLFTKAQWEGTKPIASGVSIPNGTDASKILWLKQRLTGNTGTLDTDVKLNANGASQTVYNWRYDKHNAGFVPNKDNTFEELINGAKIDEKIVYIPTGNDATSDYGDYVMFTIVADRKLAPHSSAVDSLSNVGNVSGPEWTNKFVWTGRAEPVQVIDENAPLIVFDTTNGSPEENTFPDPLLAASVGAEQKYFDLVGYTLRENFLGNNKVEVFRMAWIPYNMPGSDGKPAADSYINRVQNALRGMDKDGKIVVGGFPNSFTNDPELSGIQYWDFVPMDTAASPPAGKGKLYTEVLKEPIDSSFYIKQSFKKRFSVMGDNDDINTSTQNFTYKGKLENETKLFVIYAEDNMKHPVFRQLRLLGYKSVPEISVYEITNKINNTDMPVGSPALPNPSASGNIELTTGAPTSTYYTALNAYNDRNDVRDKLKSVAVDNNDISIPFAVYPRGTILKYLVKTEKIGRVAIEKVTMKDITFSDADKAQVIGTTAGSEALTFCESYPDVTQRTFLFEATDKLGNTARIQRTIAITNAARLENITTTSQNGTYGVDKIITLRANFSSQIYVEGSSAPLLNVCYELNGGVVYATVPCKAPIPTKTNPSLYLEFDFKVPLNALGQLKTTHQTLNNGTELVSRPLNLNGASIKDYNREDSAFVPGYKNGSVTMPNWIGDANSLQQLKTINLDGVRPKISAIKWGGKTTLVSGSYYFKSGESITLTVKSDKNIRAFGNSTLQYSIQDSGGATRGPYNASNANYGNFKYQKPGDNSQELVYVLPVNRTNCPFDGRLINVSLFTGSYTLNGETVSGNIVDSADNTVTSLDVPNVNFPVEGVNNIFIKISTPAAPVATLNSTVLSSAPAEYNTSPTLVIPASTSKGPNNDDWEDTRQYSLNGGIDWIKADTAAIPSGIHKLQVRYVDRAGNEGAVNSKDIQVNDTFPKLVSVSAEQPNGWYTSGKRLVFNLNFEEGVRVNTGETASVQITLRNRANSTANPYPAANEIVLNTSTAVSTTTYTTTIKFTWDPITGKEMKDGLYVAAVNLSGLRDRFGNVGRTGTGTWDGNISMNTIVNSVPSTYPCPNLPWTNANLCIKVDAIAPTVSNRSPTTNPTSGDNKIVKELTLTFSEAVMKGSGTITIRPRGNYAIPPVFEDEEYYLGYVNTSNAETADGAGTPYKYYESGANRTYIPSFYNVYNNSALTAQDRGYLLAGTSMSNHTLNARTGQSAGPYKKTTHGLIAGRGYSGAYSGSNVTSGANSPDTATGYMTPDTATKWVLDYQYTITQNVAAVNNIRATLNKAKFRWQEIDVANINLVAAGSATVNIALNEPLLKGLEYDVYYPAGTFIDSAGNPAPKSGNFNSDGTTAGTNTDFNFTTPGVQPPVIRVNRRSYDARTSAWSSTTGGGNTYDAPTDTATWTAATAVTDDNGWGIGNFNNIHYRVESESQSLTSMTVGTYKGVDSNRGAVTAGWTSDVRVQGGLNTGATAITNMAWNVDASNTAGTWVLQNLVHRSRSNADQTYTVITKNGISESRKSTTADANSTLRMFRSYNRDLTITELNGLALTAQTNGYQGIIAVSNNTNVTPVVPYALEASKNFVVAQATKNGVSAKGYEGVYRTVIALNFSGNKGNNFLLIEGSNIKNGMPSVAGFPVRDAEETGDRRFIKVFHQLTARTQFYWVSTEIVCEWYFLYWGGGGSHQRVGEVNNYLTVGYGDLTYAYNLDTY
jgi:hypothetical protein